MKDYKIAVRILDAKFTKIRKILPFMEKPTKGWIRAIRNSLGMSTTFLAKQLGISPIRVLAIENSEACLELKLSTLNRVAQALNCRFVYILIPEQNFEEMLEIRAEEIAKTILARTKRTMALEGQECSEEENEKQFKILKQELLQSSPKKLWR